MDKYIYIHLSNFLEKTVTIQIISIYIYQASYAEINNRASAPAKNLLSLEKSKRVPSYNFPAQMGRLKLGAAGAPRRVPSSRWLTTRASGASSGL